MKQRTENAGGKGLVSKGWSVFGQEEKVIRKGKDNLVRKKGKEN